jgi:hypothetical protein
MQCNRHVCFTPESGHGGGGHRSQYLPARL